MGIPPLSPSRGNIDRCMTMGKPVGNSVHDRKSMHEKDTFYNLMLYFVYLGPWKEAILSFLIHAMLNRGGKPK